MAGSKTWNSNGKHKRTVWQCNEKYRVTGHIHCHTPHMTDAELERAFVLAFNALAADKERYIAEYAPVVALLTDTAELDGEIVDLLERCGWIYSEIAAATERNAHAAQNQAEYRQRHAELVAQYEKLKAQLDEVELEKRRRLLKKEKIQRFLENLRAQEGLLGGFDTPPGTGETLFRTVVDSIVVYTKRDVVVRFRDGREARVNPSEK